MSPKRDAEGGGQPPATLWGSQGSIGVPPSPRPRIRVMALMDACVRHRWRKKKVGVASGPLTPTPKTAKQALG